MPNDGPSDAVGVDGARDGIVALPDSEQHSGKSRARSKSAFATTRQPGTPLPGIPLFGQSYPVENQATGKTITIVGSAIVDIPTFYDEINRVFMADEDWALGESLDALNDMLYGGYGAIAGHAPITLVWDDIEASRAALGVDTTIAFLRARPKDRMTFDGAPVATQIAALEQGAGRTYFDIVLDIIDDHPTIALVGR